VHFDLVTAIRHQIAISPISWDQRFVRGHQTERPFDRISSLNDDMDYACKAAWRKFLDSPEMSGAGMNQWEVFIAGKKIALRLKSLIILHKQDGSADEYWKNKTSADIDWTVTAKVMAKLPKPRRKWISKHVSGFCACGTMMVRMKARESDTCPLCDQPETAEHIWKCLSSSSSEIWTEGLERLRKWMQQNTTHPGLTKDILAGLNHWRKDQFSEQSPTPIFSTTAGNAQQQDGWRNFFEARPNSEWRQNQHQYYIKRKKTTKTGLRWCIAIHQQLLNTAWDFWNHRNDILHQHELALKWEVINSQITKLYNHKPTTAPRHLMNYFATPLLELLNKPVSQKGMGPGCCDRT
jgi:hypothetical protein